jgi:hypothetical protein
METLSNIFPAIPAPKFYCVLCHYGTHRKSNYDEHILTAKHIRQSNSNGYQPISSKIQQPIKYSCQNCGKEYIDNSGLWRHKKKCNSETTSKVDSNNSIEITPELIFSLIKQNNDFQQTIIEQNKTIVELSKKWN